MFPWGQRGGTWASVSVVVREEHGVKPFVLTNETRSEFRRAPPVRLHRALLEV